jgi:hypothetical protein
VNSTVNAIDSDMSGAGELEIRALSSRFRQKGRDRERTNIYIENNM